MTLFDRLRRWKEQDKISSAQEQTLGALARHEPFSVFLELNGLLYVGVIAFIGGLGWTIQTYAKQLGDQAILLGLTGLLTGCLVYCFRYASPYSSKAWQSANLIFDYVLYLGCLVWSVELSYVETRYHVLAAHWDGYLLITAFFFFIMAYRFDNRFVLSLALSTLASWFGIRLSLFQSMTFSSYRECALGYGVVVGLAGVGLERAGIKAHFSGTYLNFSANVLFAAVLSGVFENAGLSIWMIILILGSAFSAYHGTRTKQFAYVAYAAIYGYLGLSSALLKGVNSWTVITLYGVLSGVGMIIGLTFLARRFGREG